MEVRRTASATPQHASIIDMSVGKKRHGRVYKRRWDTANVLPMGDAEPQHEWGRFLRRLTTKPSKWTIKSLAETSGLSRQTVSEYIRDGAESVTIGIIRRIADASGEDFLTTLLAAGNIPRYAEMAKAIEAMGVSEQERTELLTAAAGLDPNDVNVRRILDSAASVSLKTAALRRERELQELDRKRRLEEHEIRLGERSANPRS